MKTKRKFFSLLMVASLAAIIFYACSKDGSYQQQVPAGKQNVSLYLTDGPGWFDSVLIDIKSVSVLVDTCAADTSGSGDDDDNWEHHEHRADSCVTWEDLSIQPGIYNLLDLRNGVDTLLASGNVPQGEIIKIKIELGDSNSVVKDSVSYPLHLPPGVQPYIVINLRGRDWDHYSDRHCRLWLDFDIGRSIIRVRDNMFYLAPVFHFFVMKTTGSVDGWVGPMDAFPVMTLYNDTDTAYALPGWGGYFKIRGLQAGTYSLFVNASNGYQDTTITGIQVTAGKETMLDKIKLHQ